VDTVECFGDAARGARECAVMGQAVTLARWIGSGRRPVTAGQVLRKADVEFWGDSPVEYWSEEEPEEPAAFGMKKVNRRLAALGREPE